MSGLIVGLVLRTPITDKFTSDAKFIATVYADHAWEDGSHAYPAVATVAAITGLSERTVQRYLRMLEEIGMLVINGKGPRGTNRYDFPLIESKDGSVRLAIRGGDRVTPPSQEEIQADSGDTQTPRQADGGDTVSGDTVSGDSIVSPKQTTRPLKPNDDDERTPKKFNITDKLQDDLKELGIFVSIWKDVEKRLANGWTETDIEALISWVRKTAKDKTKAATGFVNRVREGTKAPKEFYPRVSAVQMDDEQDQETDELSHAIEGDPTVTDSIRMAWGLVIEQLRTEMPKREFSTYVESTEPVHVESGVLQIGTLTPEGATWLDSRVRSTAERLLIGIMNEHVHLEFVAMETEVMQ